MVKKRKVMPFGLQKHIIEKILKKRGNPGLRKTVDGRYESSKGNDTDENLENNLESALENLDPKNSLSENIGMLEEEGYILPVPYDELEDYETKQLLQEQELLEQEEKQEKIERLKEFYGIKKKRPKRVIVDGKIRLVEDD